MWYTQLVWVDLCLSSWSGLAFVLVGLSCAFLQSFCGACLYVFAVRVVALGVKFVVVALALSRWCLWLCRGFWCC
ncbi:hypothetical protein C2G38_2256826 [Gigaspora rosea]|uniref:Transmembrane protein n=1 Tax=Gigaspora rosea TaxID=44941 RepID=A0A397TPZ8_9GLOM|nr:hypothetical protein C2G38_2256900 [Gigaspora rosea]RIB00187.1 hypothetical protein C2G38_2256826 [Gigaspora rosea]